MTQITTPLPLDQTILISHRTDRARRPAGRLGRTLARVRRSLRWIGRGDPLATPSRRALDSTGVSDMTR